MAQYINKSEIVAEIERIMAEEMSFFKDCCEDELEYTSSPAVYTRMEMLLAFLDSIEIKEAEELASVAYVVTRCEEHSDYVEKVFFDENKAHEYRDQFKGNDNEYARHITKVKVTL